MDMVRRGTLVVLALAVVLIALVGSAAAEDKQYPNWKGEWTTVVPRLPGQQLRFDPNKPFGVGQEAPLTEEYKKIYQENRPRSPPAVRAFSSITLHACRPACRP
jgi:hypothetical protein